MDNPLPLCVGAVRLEDVPFVCPFPPQPRGRLPSLFAGSQVYDTVRLSSTCMCEYGFWPSRTGLDRQTIVLEISRFRDGSFLSRVLRLRRTDSPTRVSVLRVASSHSNEVGILIYGLFAAQSPRHRCSVYASETCDVQQDSSQDGFASSFL